MKFVGNYSSNKFKADLYKTVPSLRWSIA